MTFLQELYSVVTNLFPFAGRSLSVLEVFTRRSRGFLPPSTSHDILLASDHGVHKGYIARPIPPVKVSASASASSVTSGGGSIENTSIHSSSSRRF